MKSIFRLAVVAVFSIVLTGLANAEEAKLQQPMEGVSQAPVPKALDADTEKLEKSFNELMIKEGYIQPNATNCRTECSVSCTWIDGKCQPTTTCKLVCDW